MQILSMLKNNPASRVNYVPLARQIVSQVDQSQLMTNLNRLPERAWLLQGLQQYATYDTGTGGAQDVATWCEGQWNRVLQHDPENATALKGHYFVFR